MRGVPPRLACVCIAIGLVLGAALGCTPPRDAQRPRLVVLYTTCTLRKDFLDPYAPERRLTPNLARFARESVVFERHVSEAEQSGIAFASIFCGCQADVHGVYRHPGTLGPHVLQVSEAFRDAGYDTFFWSGHPMAAPDLGYGRGVPPRHRHPRVLEEPLPYTANDAEFAALLERLRTDPTYRAFVHVTNTLTHDPYQRNATPELVERFLEQRPGAGSGLALDERRRLIAIYDAYRLPLQWNFPETVERLRQAEDPALRLREGDVERLSALLELLYAVSVHRFDELFGRWLDSIEAAGLLDESLIAFTADHGEALQREGLLFKWTHGLELAPEVLNVPLVVRAASLGVAPGRYPGVTRSIDVFPTLAGLAGIALPEEAPIEGVDLSPVLRGEAEPPDLVALFHTTTLGPHLLEQFSGRDFTGDGRADAGPLAPYTLVMQRYPREDVALCWVGARRRDLVVKKVFDGERWHYEAYDAAEDPHETRNVFDARDAAHREMAAALDAYQERLLRGRFARTSLGPDDLEKLRALGYLAEPQDAPPPRVPEREER
jgi:arylsulfatase A-like enzyme